MDLEFVKQAIIEDKAKTTSSYRRYPVRFLFMELNNNTQDEILDLVKSGNGELLELSDYIMKKDDGWLTKSRFMQIINSHVSKDKDTYVVGFSEMIRFYSKKEIESTVLSLFDIENADIMDAGSSIRRIFFVCFSMMDNVYNVLHNCFARKELINPFINSDFTLSGKYREICFVSDEYSSNIKENKIKTTVEWIGLWRNSQIIDFSKPIWVCSASLFEWHRKASPDNAFQIDVVKNTKQYIQKVIHCDICFDYVESEDYLWKEFLDDFEKNSPLSSIKEIIHKCTGADPEKIESLAGKLLNSDSVYEKWLISNYVKAYLSETFLERVLRYVTNNTNKEFLLNVWVQGYRISNPAMLQERLLIIQELNRYTNSFIPEDEIRKEITLGVSQALEIPISIDETQYGINYIDICNSNEISKDEMSSRVTSYYTKFFKPAFTGLSSVEKEFLINLSSFGLIEKNELQVIYPELYCYAYGTADKMVAEKPECSIYLEEYRKSKISNSDTPFLSRYYTEGHANAEKLYELYYSLPKQDVLVEKKRNDDTDIYVIDGVGAEYISLINELIKRNSYEIEFCTYASAHLPTITDVNKSYLNRIPYKKWIVDFDRDVIHGDYYHSNINLRKAFDYLSNIIKNIISESFGRRIIITADHGATARAKWVETPKKYSFTEADHEGRCCKIENKSDYESTSDYIVFEDELNSDNKYLISLNENSLNNRPKYEDHGGATIEELLVPVIVAGPQRPITKTSYKVFAEKLTVSGLDKTVEFTIQPETDSAVVLEENGSKHTLTKEDGMYITELDSGRVQRISVLIGDKLFEFETENIATKNMEGDDGFDD